MPFVVRAHAWEETIQTTSHIGFRSSARPASFEHDRSMCVSVFVYQTETRGVCMCIQHRPGSNHVGHAHAQIQVTQSMGSSPPCPGLWTPLLHAAQLYMPAYMPSRVILLTSQAGAPLLLAGVGALSSWCCRWGPSAVRGDPPCPSQRRPARTPAMSVRRCAAWKTRIRWAPCEAPYQPLGALSGSDVPFRWGVHV